MLQDLQDPQFVVGGQALAEQSHGLIVYMVTAEIQQHQRAVLLQRLTQGLCLDAAKTVPRQMKMLQSRV